MSTINESYFQKHGTEEPGALYILKFQGENEEFFKVGISSATSKQRLINGRMSYFRAYGYRITIENFFLSTLYNSYIIEQALIRRLKRFCYDPNFQFSGYLECFVSNPISLCHAKGHEVFETIKEDIKFWLEKMVDSVDFFKLPDNSWKFFFSFVKLAEEPVEDVRIINNFLEKNQVMPHLYELQLLQSFLRLHIDLHLKKARKKLSLIQTDLSNEIFESKKLIDEYSQMLRQGYRQHKNLDRITKVYLDDHCKELLEQSIKYNFLEIETNTEYLRQVRSRTGEIPKAYNKSLVL